MPGGELAIRSWGRNPKEAMLVIQRVSQQPAVSITSPLCKSILTLKMYNDLDLRTGDVDSGIFNKLPIEGKYGFKDRGYWTWERGQ